MTTHFVFPKPQDWNTFEDIVCDVFARKYQNLNLQRYGRNGQRQNGVDIAGLTTNGILGVQCKHHVHGDLDTKEIDGEVTKSEKFQPGLTEYVIATSADRDAKAHAHVLSLTTQRQVAGKHPVTLKFWDDICSWLSEYPDLVYKHFTKFFPPQELEHLQLSALRQQSRTALSWPCTLDNLKSQVAQTLATVGKVDPYLLSLGFTTFDTVSFSEPVDLTVQMSGLLSSGDGAADEFKQASDELKQVRTLVADSYFSKNLLVQIQARLSYAFLFGWTFRKVSGFSLSVVAGQEVWPSGGLILSPTHLSDDVPVLLDGSSSEVVLVLNISRHIQQSVAAHVASWDQQPKAILSYRLDSHEITSAAQAMTLSLEIARKIKNLIDSWGVRKIHLFGALPAALAVLVGHHLNAICPIDLYYMDETRSNYKLGGTLLNSM